MDFNIERRVLFDQAADDYDRFRPSYPEAAVERVIALSRLKSSARLLEIGGGTGQATSLFAARGFRVDSLEPGAHLARRAQEKLMPWPKVSVIEKKFEDFTAPADSYDLVFAAQSFHWIEPAVRLSKTHELLSRNGCLALLYNYTPLPESRFEEELKRVIDVMSNGGMRAHNYEDGISHWSNEIKSSGLFFNLEVERFRWERRLTVKEYLGLLRTYSDFLSLGKAERERITRGVTQVFAAHGPEFVQTRICVMFQARKNRRRATG